MARGRVRMITRALGIWKEKDQADDADGDGDLDNLFLEGGDGTIDQIGPVIGGNDLYPRGKARLNVFLDLFLDPFYDIKHVFSEADHYDPPGHLSFSIQVRHASSDFRP